MLIERWRLATDCEKFRISISHLGRSVNMCDRSDLPRATHGDGREIEWLVKSGRTLWAIFRQKKQVYVQN